MDNKGRALISLVMFAIGFFIAYKVFEGNDIGWCIVSGWLVGGMIWGWFIVGKWCDILIIKCLITAPVGVIAMAIGWGQILIAFIKFIINRVNAKKAKDAMKASNTGNEQVKENIIKT